MQPPPNFIQLLERSQTAPAEALKATNPSSRAAQESLLPNIKGNKVQMLQASLGQDRYWRHVRHHLESGSSTKSALAAEHRGQPETAQEQLATSKKVNTAFENPTSYFQSQSLDNRASDLSALLDQIGQGAQTLDAANNGLTGITSLLQQALSTAQQAQQAQNDTAGSATGTVDLSANTQALATF
jgi:hypothetical protein